MSARTLSRPVALSLPTPARLSALFAVWTLRARTRRALRDLDPARADDLGLTPEEMQREAHLPFWKV